MNIKKSTSYVEISKRIGGLIEKSLADEVLHNSNGYYYFSNDNFDETHDFFLDSVEAIIKDYGHSIGASNSLIECWLWHFPTMLGSFGYFPALAHHLIYNPVRMDLGMMQFLTTVNLSAMVEPSWTQQDIKEHYEDCISMLNEMLDHPFREDLIERNAEYYLSDKCPKNLNHFGEAIRAMLLEGERCNVHHAGIKHGFNWLYEPELYKFESFEKSSSFFGEVMTFFTENKILNNSMTKFMDSYCRGEITVGDLQCSMQMVILLSSVDFLCQKKGKLHGVGIGALSLIVKMITHGCVVRLSSVGIMSQLVLMMLDPITVHNQTYKHVVQYYASYLKFYQSNVVGHLNDEEALYLLETLEQFVDHYIGTENLIPPAKQSIKAKLKDIMNVFKNMDKEQKSMINRTFCQVF